MKAEARGSVMGLVRSRAGKASRLFEKSLDEAARRAADTCERTRQTVDMSSRLMKLSEETVTETRWRLDSIRQAREKRRKKQTG